jgi:hypothetical protein
MNARNDGDDEARTNDNTKADADNADEWLVSCRCESAKAFSTLLSCLRHTSSRYTAHVSEGMMEGKQKKSSSIQPVTVFCSPSSLTFHAHNMSKQLQASVDMPVGLFSQYRVAQADASDNNKEAAVPDWQAGGEFCINLTTLLECLQVLLGTQQNNQHPTILCFSYNISLELFKLELLQQDSGVLLTAAIPGMVTPEHEGSGDSLAHAFRSSPNAARIILKSDVLRDFVQELESVSGATNVTVVLGSNKGGLEMATVGSWSEVLVSIPAKGSHVVSWEPPSTASPPIRTYSLKALLGSMRGLDIAEETCITVNSNGMMAIQHQVINRDVGDNSPCFVDFIMCCLEHEDDDDEANDEASRAMNGSVASQSRWSQSQGYDRSAAASVATQSQAATSVRSRRSAKGRSSADDSDSDEGESHMLSTSAAPLFGSVVDDASSHTPDTRSTTSSRKARKIVVSAARQENKTSRNQHRHKKTDSDDDASVHSRNLLASSSSDTGDSSEDETQPLDVTAMASTPARRFDREAECSSPELVYGRHH